MESAARRAGPALRRLSGAARTGFADFTVRLEPEKPWRRFSGRRSRSGAIISCPTPRRLSLAHGLLAAEMGMNLQMALGQKHYLLLHAATVEKDGRALIMTGESGAGKSTLAALLGERGWRLMGDEFALLDLDERRCSCPSRARSASRTARSR